MLFHYNDYRVFLKDELIRRMKNNTQYSLRAFALSLDITHSALSQVFSGKRNFSEQRAFQVAKKLKLADQEIEYFVSLVRLVASKDLSRKKLIHDEIQSRFKGKVLNTHDLSIDEFQLIADWQHFAILQLFRISGLEISSQLISNRLGIHTLEAQNALDRLLRLGLIRKVNRKNKPILVRVEQPVRFNAQTQSPALKKYYQTVLELASRALETQSSSQRIAAGEAIALSPQSLEAARKLTYEYLDRLGEISSKDSQKSAVYQFSIHGFNLEEKK